MGATGSGLFSKEGPDKPHLLQQTGGMAAEVKDVRDDVLKTLAPMAAITVEEFTNPAAADVDALKLSIAVSTSAADYSGAALDGVVGVGTMSPPRNVTVTTTGNTPADAPATATFTGVDIDGKAISETVNVPQTATTAVGAKAFAKVTQITMPVGQGTDAAVSFGFGALIGLTKTIKTRAGAANLIREVAVGSLVTNGVIATAAVGAPHGTYAPNSAPDGTRDYAIYYEYDPYG